MTNNVITLLAAIFIALMAWRGFHRGALKTMLDWVPTLVGLPVFALCLWLAFTWTDHMVPLLVGGTILYILFFVDAFVILRKRRKRPPLNHATDESPQRHWLVDDTNRAGGALLAMVNAALLCLLIGLGGSLMIFASGTWSTNQTDTDKDQTRTTRLLETAFREVADAANLGLVMRIPGLAGGVKEVQAVIEILNASEQDRRQLVTDFDLIELIEIPEVLAALNDEEYLDMIEALAQGNVQALAKLARHPHTKKLANSPELREKMQELTPSKLQTRLSELQKQSPPTQQPSPNEHDPSSPVGD